jgi:hypothetical protein
VVRFREQRHESLIQRSRDPNTRRCVFDTITECTHPDRSRPGRLRHSKLSYESSYRECPVSPKTTSNRKSDGHSDQRTKRLQWVPRAPIQLSVSGERGNGAASVPSRGNYAYPVHRQVATIHDGRTRGSPEALLIEQDIQMRPNHLCPRLSYFLLRPGSGTGGFKSRE